MIIKGAGELFTYAKDASGLILPKFFGKQFSSSKFDFKVDVEKIFGGDGLFPIDNLLKSKELDVSLENAEFDLYQLSTFLGAEVTLADVDAEVWVMGEVAKPAAAVDPATTTTVDLGFKATYVTGSLGARYRDGSGNLTVVANAAAVTAKGMVSVDAGVVTYFTGAEGDGGKEIILYYKRTVTADTVPIMIDDEPMILGFVQQGKFRQKDNTVQAFEVEIYAAQPNGTFTIDGKRRAASTHGINLSVVDSDRADGKLGEIKRFVA